MMGFGWTDMSCVGYCIIVDARRGGGDGIFESAVDVVLRDRESANRRMKPIVCVSRPIQRPSSPTNIPPNPHPPPNFPKTLPSQNPIPLPLQPLHPLILPIIQILRRQPIILLINIPRLPPLHPFNPQLFIPAQRFGFSIVPLVAEGGGRGEEEGSGDDGGDEGEAEEEERVPGQGVPVGGGDGVLGEGFGDVFFGGEGWHGGLRGVLWSEVGVRWLWDDGMKFDYVFGGEG